MQVIDHVTGLRTLRRGLNGRIGVVPTMGALHAGHISLVEAARAENETVIATIFVNPLQFNPNEDLNKYPRDLERDLAMLEAAGVDIVFTPTPPVMYPEGFQTGVMVKSVTNVLEGAIRPGHFEGVATVVSKLFNLTQPHIAYFGQKDAQQVVVIKRLTRDLNFPLEIAVCPTMRESNGLAMSSRNTYLSAEQRHQAGAIASGLRAAGDAHTAGERTPYVLINIVKKALLANMHIDYISINDPLTLTPITAATDAPMLLSLAVRFGSVRLIDNCLLPYRLNQREALTQILGGSDENPPFYPQL